MTFKKILTAFALSLLVTTSVFSKDADSFGTKLPHGLMAKDIISLIAPTEDATNAALVGARSWSSLKNGFVAIACFPKSYPTQEQSCDNSDGQTRVYLGVISYEGAGSQPKLVAKSKSTLAVKTTFEHSNLEQPEDLTGDAAGVLPKNYNGLDLAPYKISESETAFGLRFGWSKGYAGGGAETNALALFKIDGGDIISIFSEPISFNELIAGNWNKDGTRNHESTEAENILVLSPKKTNGYFELVLKEKGKGKNKWQQKFKWDPANKRYTPTD